MRRDSTRLTDRGTSWIVSKRRAAILISYIEARTSLGADYARLRGYRILERLLLLLQVMVKERQPDNPLSKSKNREVCVNYDKNFLEM